MASEAPGSTLQKEAANGGALLSASGLVVRYGGVVAVQDVSLQVQPGEIVGLIGPNGAGKSTLLAALAGQHRAQSGSITFKGKDVTRAASYRRARLGLARTFQMSSEFQGLTVYENLMVASCGPVGSGLSSVVLRPRENRRLERAASARAWELLERFELTYAANSYGRELSGGERRLVEIMRCLMQTPDLLLLDEPTVGVTPHLVARIAEDLKRVNAEGVTLVFVEHALEVVSNVARRVVVMAEGRVIAEGTFDEVVASEEVQLAYLG